MSYKIKLNKTSEHWSIFNHSILLNSRIKFILKNKFNKEQQIKRLKVIQLNKKNDKTNVI
jgi:hypothetical protein